MPNHPPSPDGQPNKCERRKCLRAQEAFNSSAIPIEMTIMILCPVCRSKHCPHATDHDLACTNSNEPGQKGSVYE